MGVLEQLSRKSGVIVGDDVLRLFEHAQANNYAIPAIVSVAHWPPKRNGVIDLASAERDIVVDRRRGAGSRP